MSARRSISWSNFSEISSERTAEVLQLQINRLQARRKGIDDALAFLKEKLAWARGGKWDRLPGRSMT